MPLGKVPLRITLDETSICLFQGQGKGTVMTVKNRSKPMQNVSRSKRRRCLTHVAFVCDRADLQPLLPQVLIGSEATFLSGLLPALNLDRPANVVLIRQKSAWNCSATCASIIRTLGAKLAPYLDTVQPILLLDAVRLHTTPQVLAACNAKKVWPVLVPAKLTWLLQPLDTDAFLPFKRHLQKAYQDARAGTASGDLTTREFLPCVYDAVKVVLEGRPWGLTFAQNGFGDNQRAVSAHVMRQLQIESPPSIPASRPTLAQLECCFQKRTKVPTATLWRPFDHAPAAASPPSSSSSSRGPVLARAAVLAAREPRTRAEHRRAAKAESAIDVSPACAANVRSGRPLSDIPALD